MNSISNVNPVSLRPPVPTGECLEKWQPAFTISSTIPSHILLKQKKVAIAAYAPSTRNTYGTGLLKYHSFCDIIALPEINRTPCTTTIISGFITYLSGNYSKSAITSFIAGVKVWHAVNSITFDIDDKIVSTLLRGAARLQPPPQSCRLPLTLIELEQILQNVNLENPEQVAFAACLTTTFFCCARLGEFTVLNVKSFNPKKHITISNVSFQHDRYFNKVTAFTIPHTKVSITGETVFWAKQKLTVDPQTFFFLYLKMNEPRPHEHLFSFKTYNKKIPMTRSIFLRNLNMASTKAKVQIHSGHSIRIGATLEYLL